MEAHSSVEQSPIEKDVPVRRMTASIGVAALLAASLAGCTALPGFGGCDPVFEAGDSSRIVTSNGSTADFPTPLVVTSPEVSTLSSGDGALVQKGDQVAFTVTTFFGADGQKLSGDSAAAGLPAFLLAMPASLRGTKSAERLHAERAQLTTRVAPNARFTGDSSRVTVGPAAKQALPYPKSPFRVGRPPLPVGDKVRAW